MEQPPKYVEHTVEQTPLNAWNNPPKYVEQTVEQDAESRGTKGGILQQSVAVPRYLSEVAGGVGAGAGACST